jgi:hypothetical protein
MPVDAELLYEIPPHQSGSRVLKQKQTIEPPAAHWLETSAGNLWDS